MEEALTAHLLQTSALTALVGTRITWSQRTQGDALPAIVLTMVTTINEYADEGFVGLRANRVQIDCWSADSAARAGASDAILVSRAVKASLANVQMTVGGVEFQAVIPENDGTDTVEQGLGGIVEFRRRMEFLLWNVEALGG